MGTKRPHEDTSFKRNIKGKIKAKRSWSLGLLETVKDPEYLIEEDDRISVIKDKYPKAKFHFLVLPKEDIANLSVINRAHLPLLQHMHKVGESICQKYANNIFRLGYHALPSMTHLHLHIISNDFISPCLKTKRHWNSFNTNFFISSEDIIAEIEEKGSVSKMAEKEAKAFLGKPLVCHKCSFQPKNMPKLKEHLLKHV